MLVVDDLLTPLAAEIAAPIIITAVHAMWLVVRCFRCPVTMLGHKPRHPKVRQFIKRIDPSKWSD